MKSIYKLQSSSRHNSAFVHNVDENSPYLDRSKPDSEMSIAYHVIRQCWKPYTENYVVPKLTLRSSDDGKKNYKFDLSSSLSPFYVFSEKAADILTHILKPRGQFLEVKTESKRKSFVGYYPTNPLRNCLDMERSVYEKYGKGLVVRRAVLIEKNITDEYLFSIEEDISTVFVTEKFKNLIEERGLIGFDFSREIELS